MDEDEYVMEGGDDMYFEDDSSDSDAESDASGVETAGAATNSSVTASTPSHVQTHTHAHSAAGAAANLCTPAGAQASPALAVSPHLAALYSRPAGVMTSAMIVTRMRRAVADLASLLCVTSDESFILLKQHGWKSEQLTERFFDDPAAARAAAGVSEGPDPPPLPSEPVFCAVTMDDVSPKDCDACACGHWFSKEAWQGHIEAAMNEPRAALLLRCMAEGCKEVVRPRMFRTYLSDEMFAIYEEYQARSFAEEHPLNVWCPHPGCSYIICREGGSHADVACPAGHTFCTKCKAGPHRPATCTEATAWRKREGDDGQNAQWLLAHTKPCPRCAKHIEKNQGCNHMTCRKEAGGCGHEFCWICLGAWATHARDYYNCSVPPPKSMFDADAAQKVAAELSRYTQYYDRYANAMQGRRLALTNMKAEMATRQTDLLSMLKLPIADVDFLDHAVELVARGREVAAWSWVHAFYVTDPSYRALFSDSQGQLERNLEHLHGLLELTNLQGILSYGSKPEDGFDPDDPVAWRENFIKWRMDAVNLMGCTERFMREIIVAVEDGFVSGASGSGATPIAPTSYASPRRRNRSGTKGTSPARASKRARPAAAAAAAVATAQ